MSDYDQRRALFRASDAGNFGEEIAHYCIDHGVHEDEDVEHFLAQVTDEVRALIRILLDDDTPEVGA